jgi:hypothetical protein
LDPIANRDQVACFGPLLEPAAQAGSELALVGVYGEKAGLRADNDAAQ